MQTVWIVTSTPASRLVAVFDPRRPLFALTVKGRGYRLRAQTQ